LAAVRFIRDHDDVPALGEERRPAALLFRHKLLDRGENHAAAAT
jgi:hypothetical protein